MASDGFGLYTLKTGKTASRLTGEQIDELEKGYVGSAVRLLAYETGAFSGIPSNLPRDFVVWQDRRFSFSTQLVILQDRSNNANTKPDASELSPARKRGAGVSEHTNVLPK